MNLEEREKEKPCGREGQEFCWKDGKECQFMQGYKCQQGIQYTNIGIKILETEVALKNIAESRAIIRQNENIVGIAIINIGKELKYIRDNQTYKQIGIKSFEEYCEKELDYSRRNAYNYITVAEKFVHPGAQIQNLGVKKLLALASLDEEECVEFIGNNNVEEMTVKELEAEVKVNKKMKLLEAELKESKQTEKLNNKELKEKDKEIKRLKEIAELTGGANGIDEMAAKDVLGYIEKTIEYHQNGAFKMPAVMLRDDMKEMLKPRVSKMLEQLEAFVQYIKEDYEIQ